MRLALGEDGGAVERDERVPGALSGVSVSRAARAGKMRFADQLVREDARAEGVIFMQFMENCENFVLELEPIMSIEVSMNAGFLQFLPFRVGYTPSLPCFVQLRGMSENCGEIALRKAMHCDDWGEDPDIQKGFPPPQPPAPPVPPVKHNGASQGIIVVGREWEEYLGEEGDFNQVDKKEARFSASLILSADIQFAAEDDDKWGDDQDGDDNRRDQSPKKPKISGRLALYAIMLGHDDWPPDTNGNVPLIKSPPDVRTPSEPSAPPPEPPPPPPPDSDK